MEQSGRWDEARAHYILARECDAMPFVAPRHFARHTAKSRPSIRVCCSSTARESRTASRHGILDDSFFHDAQHPNLRGYALLAQDVLDQLHPPRLRLATGQAVSRH